MLRNAVYGLVLTVAMAGCSSLPMMTKEEPDTTPQNPTAVLETHVVSDGIKGFFPFEGTSKTYTRPAMQRDDTAFKGTGTVTRFFVGTNSTSRIERLDRKLVWTMDVKEKTYTECPLKGCGGPVAQTPQEKKPEKQDKPRESDCKVKIASTSFTVKPTGQKKAINGFDTDEYQVVWLITLQDPQARKTVSTLNVDLWTTPTTPALKEAMAVEQAYARSLASNMAAVTTNEKAQVVPAEAAKMINAYLATLMGTSDKAAFLNAGKQLEKIKGQPVLTQLEWDMKGDACTEKQADAGSSSSGSKDLMSTVTDLFSSKKSDDSASKPIFSFTSEVKSHKVEAVHDSVFSPPKGYTLATPK
jgi:hypothetical protein